MTDDVEKGGKDGVVKMFLNFLFLCCRTSHQMILGILLLC